MSKIAAFVHEREITRLCHLTPLRNLIQIARGQSLLSITELEIDERAVYDRQDLLRLDGRPDHISCSIEYPNVWYLRQRAGAATALQKLFPHWVCLAIDPAYLSSSGTLFCPRNAASGSGRYVTKGLSGLQGMYASAVVGSGGRTYRRGLKPKPCPTDDQAEVLIAKAIPLKHAQTVIVASEEHACEVYLALEYAHVDVALFRWVIAPECFEPSLAQTLRAGRRPEEVHWMIRSIDGY